MKQLYTIASVGLVEATGCVDLEYRRKSADGRVLVSQDDLAGYMPESSFEDKAGTLEGIVYTCQEAIKLVNNDKTFE